MRRLRRRRVWRRRLRWIDPEKPPLTVLRWLAIIALAVTWWATGAKTSPPHYWVPYVVVAAALMLPDIAGLAVGGFRLDLKQVQAELATLKLRIDMRQEVTTINYFGALERATEAQTGEDAPKRRRVLRPPVDDSQDRDVSLGP
jgi:hypothetical protein